MRSFVRASAIAALVLFISASAWAQATAQFNGTVRDETGAVLPGVTVTATQTDTGLMRSVVTDENGAYVITNLPTGPYRLEVSLQGFRTYSQTGIVLQVGGTPTINAVLAVGSLEETVAVEAAAPLVDVRSAGISEVIEQERILELPLQGRNVTDLIVLAGAAVQSTPGNKSIPGSVLTSVAGGLPFGVTYLLDGAAHNNPFDNLNMPLPFPDALQEFRVATSGLSADNGVHSGGSVNAVTKSGTNAFHGTAFEFFRDKRFNAKPVFAPNGPDGKKLDDGLSRNQFGGTIGGPIVHDRLFFFGGYQGTKLHVTPPDAVSKIPTPAMLAGDFTAFASPACNRGQQLTLRAPFANNRIDPTLLSPAALKIASRLPTTTDPCGDLRYSAEQNYTQGQTVGRVDFQMTPNQTVFGRYMFTFDDQGAAWPASGNFLTTLEDKDIATSHKAHSLTAGQTMVLGSSTVNSFRVSWNRANTRYHLEKWFGAEEMGVKDFYNYLPGYMRIQISGAFNTGSSFKYEGDTDAYQASDDVTLVRGNHQLGFGAHVSHAKFHTLNAQPAPGYFNFNGGVTGSGLGDFLTGRLFYLEQAVPGVLDITQPYIGAYAQDAWRMHPQLTLNAGVRWEPFFGQSMTEAAVISNFSLERFREGVKTTKYQNAPPGLIYPGDPGYPAGRSGMQDSWLNLAPRVGLAWDVTGDGRTAVRSSYGLGYDFQTADWAFIATSSPPYGNRRRINNPVGGLDNPYLNVPGGPAKPLPSPPPFDVDFGEGSTFFAMDPNINSTRAQSWNVILERQIGSVWQASAGYLGSYIDRIWGWNQENPGVFLGLGPCTLNGVAYPVCSTDANLNARRKLSLENPQAGRAFGAMGRYVDWGTQDYHALRLSGERRAATGLRLSGNYTRSYCVGNWINTGLSGQNYTKTDDAEFDRGNCSYARRHIANLTVGAQTPSFANPALSAIASDWTVSGILNARSGAWLNVVTSRDIAMTGAVTNVIQRPNQVLDDPYGDGTVNNFLNRNAYAYPALGSLGTSKAYSVEGPGFWSIDMALARNLSLGGARTVELRLETFNLLNHFNLGNPIVNLDAANFGQIQTQAGASRVLQFGLKYGF